MTSQLKAATNGAENEILSKANALFFVSDCAMSDTPSIQLWFDPLPQQLAIQWAHNIRQERDAALQQMQRKLKDS
jgi:hypothetical protein